MTCCRCAAGIDYCVRPWFSGEDGHNQAHYPPSRFKRFLAISRDGEVSVFGIREGEHVYDGVLKHFLLTDDYCEAKAYVAVLTVNST